MVEYHVNKYKSTYVVFNFNVKNPSLRNLLQYAQTLSLFCKYLPHTKFVFYKFGVSFRWIKVKLLQAPLHDAQALYFWQKRYG